MRLLETLAVGISDAPSGTVAIRQRGTTTAATVYSDFDGLSVTTSMALDASGRKICYVDEVVDVVVYDSAGAVVTTFTDGDLAQGVSVRNDGFTGANPDGSTSAGGLTDLDTVLSSLHTSLGSTDGKVLFNGSGSYLKDALAAVQSGVYYDVKNGYGAAGTGATDDSPYVQAAIDAACAAGGGCVIVPEGTYLCNSALALYAGVSMLGVGYASYIKGSSTAITNVIGLYGRNTVSDLRVACNSSDACVGDVGTITTGATITRCTLTNITGTGTAIGKGVVIDSPSRGIRVTGNVFSLLSLGVHASDTTVPDGVLASNNWFVDTRCSAAGAFANNVYLASSNSGTGAVLHTIPNATAHSSMSGNSFEGLSTQYAYVFPTQSGTISVASNTFDTLKCCSSAQASSAATIRFVDRDERQTVGSYGAVLYNPDTEYGIHVITLTGTSFTVAAPSSFAYEGAVMDFRIKATNGSNCSVAWSTAWKVATTPVTFAQNHGQYWRFRQSGGQWVLMSTSGDLTLT